jgi:AraC-like DNA-binding protein
MRAKPSDVECGEAGEVSPAEAPWNTVKLNSGMVIKDSRQHAANPVADKGTVAWTTIAAGKLDIVRLNIECQSDYDKEVTGPALFKIAFYQYSQFALRFDSLPPQHFTDRACNIIGQPAGMIKRQYNLGGTREEGAVLIVRPEFLHDDTLCVLPGALPEPLKTFARRPLLDDLSLDRFPMTAAMQRHLAGLLAIDPADALSGLLIEAKVLELFFHFLSMLRQLGNPESAIVRLAPRERIRLYDVKQLLRRSFTAPPDLNELANTAGICRSKLVSGFRQEFGISIGAFCLEQRMAKARHLITTTDSPLGSVAYMVGYKHPSSFSCAYRAYFGRSPKEDRISARFKS